MKSTCIRLLASEAGQLRDRSLDGEQVSDDLDGLGSLGLARELVEVVADAGDLHGALALDGDGRGRPHPRPGHGLP